MDRVDRLFSAAGRRWTVLSHCTHAAVHTRGGLAPLPGATSPGGGGEGGYLPANAVIVTAAASGP